MPPKRFATLVPMDTDRIYGPANKYDPEYCDRVRVYGQEGMFPEEWCAHIGVTMPTLFNWANAYPEFEFSIERRNNRPEVSAVGDGAAPNNNVAQMNDDDLDARIAELTDRRGAYVQPTFTSG